MIRAASVRLAPYAGIWLAGCSEGVLLFDITQHNLGARVRPYDMLGKLRFELQLVAGPRGR